MKLFAPAAALVITSAFITSLFACSTNDVDERASEVTVNDQGSATLGCRGGPLACPNPTSSSGGFAPPPGPTTMAPGSEDPPPPPKEGSKGETEFQCPIGVPASPDPKVLDCGVWGVNEDRDNPGVLICSHPKCIAVGADGGGAGGYIQYQSPCPLWYHYACDNTGHCYCR